MDRNNSNSELSSSDEDEELDEFSMSDSTDIEYENEKQSTQPTTMSNPFCLRGEKPRVELDKKQQTNIVQKLINREYSGKPLFYHRSERPFYNAVPNRLSFCLKYLVPSQFLDGQVFMGLTLCGQFLISYSVCCNDNTTTNPYSLAMGYKYTLHFWIYQPFKSLRSFYKCCLFDDHGVDNMKNVSIIQWKCTDPRILIVHGASEDENEESYITYVKVPKLGCLDCMKLRGSEEEVFSRHSLCLKCNLTVHTKYSTTESDLKFNPYTHLLCPERILIISNGFFHMLHIRTDATNQQRQQQCAQDQTTNNQNSMTTLILRPLMEIGQETFSQEGIAAQLSNGASDQQYGASDRNGCEANNQKMNELMGNVKSNIASIQSIIDDFADFESDSVPSGSDIASIQADPRSSPLSITKNSCEELILSCSPIASSRSNVNSGTVNSSSISSKINNSPKNNSNKAQRNPSQRHRIVTVKPFRRGVYNFFSNISNPSTSIISAQATNSTNNDRAATYEFSEDNEKCEKISILRKRRLAERKYEFSEDNSENIIPFTKIRTSSSFNSLFSTANSDNNSSRRNQNANHLPNNSAYVSPTSSPHPYNSSTPSGVQYEMARHCTPPAALSPLHHTCTSPLSFRSPPYTSIMRSPSRHLTTANIYCNQKSPQQTAISVTPAAQYVLNFKSPGVMSPLPLPISKRSHLDVTTGSVSPNNQLSFLSPRREELRIVEVPLHGGMSEKPVCTKKFQRRYVDEDDAASVITSEEDDCISPGYHTLLPLEVHGSCYSEMQMISKASYQQLCCTSVIIEQHSFDIETFTYYCISTLCQKNQKIYDFFHDWAYEMINICPLTCTVFCLLMAQFSCREEVSSCQNCSRKLNCAFHMKKYECRVLFAWNMVSGDWEVLDFGELYEHKLSDKLPTLDNDNRNKHSPQPSSSLSQKAKTLAREMSHALSKLPDYTYNLRVLDSNIKKSKKSITDYDNMIEFHQKRRTRSRN